MIATTINMRMDTLERLSRAAIVLRISRRDVIVSLLMRIMSDVDKYRRGFSTVRYQHDDPDGRWHCFFIRFKDDENEFFTDLRNFCKCSVSLLVALAVEIYLDKMLKEIENNAYNNICYNYYAVQFEVTHGRACWKIDWGNPEKAKTTSHHL